MTSYKVGNKINSNGKYNTFNGITIISKIHAINHIFCKDLFNILDSNDLVKEYYSLLPISSYHMTIFNIVTQKSINTHLNEYVSNNKHILDGVNCYLSDNFSEIKTKIKCVVVEGVISLILELSEHDKQLIKKVSDELKIIHKIPEYFHVTLAYLYKDIRPEICKQIFNSLSINFNNDIVFEYPQLTYFYDMTQFNVWKPYTPNPFDNK